MLKAIARFLFGNTSNYSVAQAATVTENAIAVKSNKTTIQPRAEQIVNRPRKKKRPVAKAAVRRAVVGVPTRRSSYASDSSVSSGIDVTDVLLTAAIISNTNDSPSPSYSEPASSYSSYDSGSSNSSYDSGSSSYDSGGDSGGCSCD